MNERDRDILRRNRAYLVENLMMKPLLDGLICYNVFTDNMVQDIVADKTQMDQARRLLNDLPRRGPNAYAVFLRCLQESGQGHVADHIEGRVSSHQSLHLHQSLQSTSIIAHPTDQMPKPNDRDIYQVNSLPRGTVLIINNKDFDQHTVRIGSEKDVLKLTLLFKQLKFEVLPVVYNASSQVLREELKKFALLDSHIVRDSAVVIILSHGKESCIFGADNVEVPILEIFKYLNGKTCPALRGKPKLFVIQAYRRDPNVTTEADGLTGLAQPPPAYDDVIRELQRLQMNIDEEQVNNDADRVVAYCALPGHMASIDREQGTWYINCLYEIFLQYAKTHHVIDLLVKVNNLIDSQYHYQMPEPMFTLRKDWFLDE